MKLPFSIILFSILFCSQLRAQENFPRYLELSITAREHFDVKEYQSAINDLNAAFQIVKYPAYRDVDKALQIAVILNDTMLINRFCGIMVTVYGIFPQESKIKNAAFYSTLRKRYKNQLAKTIANFDKVYSRKIDSLKNEDQLIRKSGNAKYKNNINSDSIRVYQLLELIATCGFPEPRIVGMKAYSYAMLIFTHADFDLNNELLGGLMYDNVMNGKMDPRDYAGIIDRRCNFSGNASFIYYEVPIGYDNLSMIEKKKISERRRKIGLRPVENSMRVEKLPNGDVSSIRYW